MSLSANVIQRLMRNVASLGDGNDSAVLNDTLRLLAKWRSQLIANTMIVRTGLTVQGGPFAGMKYMNRVAEGALPPRLLGCYESELHPHIEKLLSTDLEHIIDIGCAEGYYAVGFKLRAPNATVHAHDVDHNAQNLCRMLAIHNNVELKIGGLFPGEDFEHFAGTRTLVFVDIEGGEGDLLDPERFPALKTLSVIVETHPSARPGITDQVASRFAATHHVERIEQRPPDFVPPPWLAELSHLDMLLAGWEWRGAPTPWLVMQPL